MFDENDPSANQLKNLSKLLERFVKSTDAGI
jgi:hypothetical protein